MRIHTGLLLLPLAIGLPSGAVSGARILPAAVPPQIAADSTTVTVRWHGLVARFMEETAASKRAATAAATAAGDSAALRRIARTQPPMLMHLYPVLSLAQYSAGSAARSGRTASPEIAVASASAAVLTEQFTDSTVRASIARELARDIEQAGQPAARKAAGRSLGEDVARRVMARAPKFDLVAPWNGTVPTGPGMWYSAPGVPPLGIAAKTARGWLIDSASQHRPAAPPAYDSPAWRAAIEEVRVVAKGRTAEQKALAQKWNGADPFAVWNETANAAIRRRRMSDVEAARVLTVINMAVSDALVACFEAKYHYWTIRPSQADTSIKLPERFGLPNFPSYPSGHACSAGAFEATLSHFFPESRAEFSKTAEDQAMSRLYGSVHYRFDNDDGLALGRTVARYGIDREKRGGLKAWHAAAVGVADKP